MPAVEVRVHWVSRTVRDSAELFKLLWAVVLVGHHGMFEPQYRLRNGDAYIPCKRSGKERIPCFAVSDGGEGQPYKGDCRLDPLRAVSLNSARGVASTTKRLSPRDLVSEVSVICLCEVLWQADLYQYLCKHSSVLALLSLKGLEAILWNLQCGALPSGKYMGRDEQPERRSFPGKGDD